MYLHKGVDAMFTTCDNFNHEKGVLIPKKPDTARVTSGVHSVRVGIGERVNHSLSPIIRNARLNDNQHFRMVPTVELIGMCTKHLISDALTVPGDHLHGCGKGGEGLIRDFPCRGIPRRRQKKALMPRCGGHDAIQCFHIAEPGPVRAGHDKW